LNDFYLTRLVLDRFIKKKNLNLKIGFSKMHKWDFYRDTIILANEKVEFAMG